MKNLKIELEKATEVIKILQKYNFIRATQIEMDDSTQEIYTYDTSFPFIALMIFAREIMIGVNHSFNHSDGTNKPYLS